MSSAVLEEPKQSLGKYRPKFKDTKVYGELAKQELASTDINDVENRRRAKLRAIAYLGLLADGLMPYEAKQKLGLREKEANCLKSKVHSLIKKHQARKIEELIFIAELRHNKVYREAMEAFEQSKKDAKGNTRPGNPIFLTIANESVRDFRKLLGLDKTTDIINNGQLNLINWDSLHNAQATKPDVKSIEGSAVDPIEQRIRELEQKASEREQLLEDTIKSEELISSQEVMPEPRSITVDASVVESVEPVIEPTIEPRKVKIKIKEKAITVDDAFAV